MFGELRTSDCYSRWSHIRSALKKLGLRFGPRAYFVSKWESIPDIAIVGCSRKKNGDWHWVVCVPKEALIYDPQRARPVPFSKTRRRPFSYLLVRPRLELGSAESAIHPMKSRLF